MKLEAKNDADGRNEQSTKQQLGSVLPIGPVGIPEATTVLCGGDGEMIRALVLGLALISAVILLRTGYRVARRAIGSTTDPMTSILAAILPGLYLIWLAVAGSNVVGCLFAAGRIQQLFGTFMAIGMAIVDTIG